MAKDTLPARVPLTRARLAVLQTLTQAISEAVLAADLDRAATLLEQRRLALHHLDWATVSSDQLQGELETLCLMEAKLLDFCRSWREILQEQLQKMSSGLHLRRCYCPASTAAHFVDMHK